MIKFSLLPIDVGFNLKVLRMKVILPDVEEEVFMLYEGRNGERKEAVGKPRDIVKKLRANGYCCVLEK